MRHQIFKVFTIADYEKEEKWLNELSTKGLQLIEVGFCRYVFMDGTPGEYEYRLELLEHVPNHPESKAYFRFMEEMGITHVASYMRWAYFRKKADGEPFDIYSDLDSKIKHYGRIFSLAAIVSAINLFAVMLTAGMHVVFLVTKGLHGIPFAGNAVISGINLALCVTLGIFSMQLYKRIEKLKNEKLIRE